MKRKLIAEYIAFTGKLHPLILLGLFAISCLICYVISGLIWQLSLIVAPILSMGFLSFMDYFPFAGTNAKKARGMELVKSSPYGGEILKRALKQDLIIKSLFSFILTALIVVLILTGTPRPQDIPFVIIYAFAAYATGQLFTRITLFFTRKKGLTMQSHIMIVYIFFFAGSLILLPLIFLSDTNSVPLMLLYACAAEILSVLSAIWLLTSCNKAFATTFYDT